MKKSKTQKGITLIALIITIVVLMVLAAVAISSIQNDGIIAHANNAANEYIQKQEEEQTILGEYNPELDKYAGGIGGSTGGDVVATLGTPIISLSGDTLTITAVTNATTYAVYVNGTVQTNTTSTTVDLTTLNLEAGEYQITVIAKAEGYTNSVASNEVSYTITNGYTVSGTWVFNNTISTVTNLEGLGITQYISNTCTSNGNVYVKIFTEPGNFNDGVDKIYYSTTSTSLGTMVYKSTTGWVNSNYRTINFGSIAQEVEEEFYIWLTTNATKQD